MEVVGGRGGRGVASGGVRLHCFHHAGGSPAAFRRWSALLGRAQVVAAVVGDGAAEEVPTVGGLVARWRSVTADRSGVYYGHSLGALVAFEAAVAAVAEGDASQVPAAVVMGAPPAPGSRAGVGRVVGGAARVRLLRDLERVRRYRPGASSVPVPVHVLWGADDEVVGEREARAWVRRGGAGSAWWRLERAGHLFHLAPGDDVREVLGAVLDGAAGRTVAR